MWFVLVQLINYADSVSAQVGRQAVESLKRLGKSSIIPSLWERGPLRHCRQSCCRFDIRRTKLPRGVWQLYRCLFGRGPVPARSIPASFQFTMSHQIQ
ncbi:hypothetical protein OG21DRAFT_1022956 [Imleria badia]|nr:hypothetical protein OG21DRAFT_1022956 [Imleria badia]